LTSIANEILNSQRIFLDDDLVEAAVTLSCSPPSLLLQTIPHIQPLGNSVWVEWDETVRLTQLQALGYGLGSSDYVADGAAQCGFLINSIITNGNLLIRIQIISYLNSQKQRDSIIPHMIGFWFAPRDLLSLPTKEIIGSIITGDDLGVASIIQEREKKEGYKFALGQRWHQNHHTLSEAHAYTDIANRIVYGWFGLPAFDDIKRSGWNPNQGELITNAGVAVVGDCRFLIALLILATTVETISEEAWTSVGGRAPRNSALVRLPGNIFRTLKLALPRERIMERIANYQPPATPTGRRMREHNVVAHMCRSRKRGSPICAHEFDNENLPRFCIHCGYREWARREHKRGDPSLGTVYGPRVLTSRDNR
jgi:hypothetical protein